MKLLVAIDHHFFRDPTGGVFLGPPMSISGYQFWQRYLEVFEEVVVLARVRSLKKPAEPSAVRAGGPRVIFHDLPDYLGPWEYLYQLRALKKEVRRALEECDAYILRIPGAVGQLAWRELRRQGRPYALEVVADPWDILSPAATPSIVRPIVRRRWSNCLRRMCWEASAVCYVTREALQRRYPPGPGVWTACASDVELPTGIATPEILRNRLQRIRQITSGNGSTNATSRIGFVGALAQMYKALDVLLNAVALCLRSGQTVELAVAGDGKFRRPMEDLARRLGIGLQVNFLGALEPGPPVLAFLDSVDLFVLPSRQEGLPRALIEAMSRGCPCIASCVGGIPELLEPEDLVPPGDVQSLAGKLSEVLRDPERLERMALQNLEKAREYL
ncbi:MAG: glycosyltransferase, partial [Terriglobia bacterium]